MKRLIHLLALGAMAASAHADFYWLHEGKLATGRSDDAVKGQGWGSVLTLTNDTEGVEYKRVQIHDIRLESNGSTRFVKQNANSANAPFDGCRYGEAEVDFTLPIRRADGTEYTLVKIADNAFSGNSYIGKVVLSDKIESICQRAFINCYYLRTVVFPDPSTWRPTTIGSTGDGRVFDACNRIETPHIWPDNIGFVGPYNFSGSSTVGFYGAGVTNFYGGAFNGASTNFRLEIGDADTLHFLGEVLNNTNLRTVIWHTMPPSTGDYFSKKDKHFMSYSSTSRVHYIPYDETTEDGVPARWAAYKSDFEAETSGNSLTFPVYDPETGTQTDGSWYVNGRAASADKIRFYFPGATAALLMK